MKETIAESLEKYSDYILEASKLGNVKIMGSIDKIVVCGVGNSGIVGNLLKNYFEELALKIPVFPVKDFEIPVFCDSKTLVFIVSCSGNTLEAIKCYRSAVGRGCKIITITAGGKLREICKENNVDVIKIPENVYSIAAFPFLFIPILNVLKQNNLIEEIDFNSIAEILKRANFQAKVSEISKKLVNKTPIIYSSKRFEGVAIRWKNSFNEIAKIEAHYNVFPEVAHNEINAFEEAKPNNFLIFIVDEDDNKYVKKQIDSFRNLIIKKAESTELRLKGADYLKKLFLAVYIGDLISLELCELLEKNPEETKMKNQIKEETSRVI
ncbi:MAG: bifunctional phosphoglucose/phosphomannose isomerase [Candidatus Woesearchaeota archaeon]